MDDRTFTLMNRASQAAAIDSAAKASLRSTLTPTGTVTAARTAATTRVSDATVTGGTWSAKKGASP